MLDLLASVVETALMVLEPAYKTYKELSGGGGGGRTVDGAVPEAAERRRQLLVHWIVYAAFRAVDCVARPWVPMYSLISIAAVVWLRAGGSETVYETAIRPFLSENEAAIDQWFDRFDRAKESVANTTTAMSMAAAAAVSAADADADAEADSDSDDAPTPVQRFT